MDVHIRRLREKLELDPANPEYIRTKWGVGYYFKDKRSLLDSLQFKFGLSYLVVIAAVLLLLNTYPLLVSEDLVFRSKEKHTAQQCLRDGLFPLGAGPAQ